VCCYVLATKVWFHCCCSGAGGRRQRVRCCKVTGEEDLGCPAGGLQLQLRTLLAIYPVSCKLPYYYYTSTRYLSYSRLLPYTGVQWRQFSSLLTSLVCVHVQEKSRT